ncbi:hypothetical protein FA13DRAFT_1748513, partial [Coprinellus micaceus]
MKFTTFTAGALAAIFLPRVLAEDVTLFQLVENPFHDRLRHPLGGETQTVYTNRLMTLTLIPSPTTTNVSGVKGTREDDCTTDPSTGKMVCVVRSVVATVTGTGAPWFTVTGVENLNLPTVD